MRAGICTSIWSLVTWWLSHRKCAQSGRRKPLTSSRSEGNLVFAIYVRSVQKQQQFYTQRGKWRIGFHKDLDYVIKGFLPPDSVEPLLPYFPAAAAQLSMEMQSNIEGGVPRTLGAPLLEEVASFSMQAMDFYRENTERLDALHELVANEEDTEEYTIEELACKALDMNKSELNDVILFAVHRAASRCSFVIQDDRSSVFTDHYLVQPRRVARTIEMVNRWVHQHQDMLIRSAMGKETPGFASHPIEAFLAKCRRLINASRKVRSPTKMANVGPTSHRYVPGKDGKDRVFRETMLDSFNKFDKIIIEYLQLWCIPPRRMTLSALRSTGSHIMRATGMYNGVEVTAASVPLFLQELGVLYPWENVRLLDLALRLPGHGISRRSDEQWEEVQQESKRLASEGFVDSMKDMRTDWGDLPIYCVDDVNAQEIDDGVSLEPVPSEDGVYWIRVHVANPSAFISHDNIIMQYAASRNQTVYTPDRTYPMLPTSMTQSQFSLAPGRPTLTFSAKMNRQGDVLETDIRNGTARNVVYITHAQLRSLFEPVPENPPPLTVGGTFTATNPREGIMQETLTPEDSSTFTTLRDLILSFREHRLKNGAIEFPNSPDTSVSVSTGLTPIKPYRLDHIPRGRFILGDPIIQLRPQDLNPHEVPDMSKRYLVSLLMNLACWVSGKWCAERGIPVIYDGTMYHPEYRALTNQNISNYGGNEWLRLAAPKGVSSSSPLHHAPLGLDAYVKSTSPLRRYSDLLAHYQIEAALRYEAENNTRLTIPPPTAVDTDTPTTESTTQPTTDTTPLPHTHQNIETYLHKTRWLRSRIREVSTASHQHWATMLLFRAFYFAECALPETFTCLLHKPYTQTSLAGTQFSQGYAGSLVELGVKCQVVFPETRPEAEGESEGEGSEMGMLRKSSDEGILSLVEARITGVDLGRLLVIMEGVRVIRRFERVGEWR